MQGKNIEPGWVVFAVGGGFGGTGKGKVSAPPHAIEAFVAHAAEPIQSDLGVALFQENWVDPNVLGVGLFSKIVDKIDHI